MWSNDKRVEEVKKSLVLNITWVIEQVLTDILECSGGYISCAQCPYNFVCPTARFFLDTLD